MIEKIVYDHMAAALDVPVYMEIPANPPAAFVVIEKTRSAEKDHFCQATFAMQSYGPSLLAAAQLNELTKAAAKGLTALGIVTRAEIGTDYNFTDTATKRYRYQAVVNIWHYEEDV